MKLYHYTSRVHLAQIGLDGFLRVTESNISPTERLAGPNVVWLTSSHDWDKQSWMVGSAVDKTEVRFTVEVPHRDVSWWPEWSARHEIDIDWYDSLNEAGGGNAERWYVCERPIFKVEWLEVEVRGVTR